MVGLHRSLAFAVAAAAVLSLALLGQGAHAFGVQASAVESVYYPLLDTWRQRRPSEPGFDEPLLAQAVEWAMAHDAPGPRDFAGQARGTGLGRVIGPLPTERAGVNGIIVRHGYIAAEFGDTLRADPSYSVAKSYILASLEPGRASSATSAAAADTKLLKVGENGVRLPARIKHVTPVVPPDVVPRGVVVLEFIVSPMGRVDQVTVLARVQPPEPALDEAAIAAVRQWEFEPTVIDGVAYPIRVRASINFNNPVFQR